MAQCNDCWCEHYDKSKGNCDQCIKKETSKSKPDLAVILKRRAVKQMEPDERKKVKGQSR
jgi:hypothetical protein